MISENQFKELMQKLNTLIRLTALNTLKGKNKTEQILLLSDLGLNNKQIADIVGTTPESVRVRRSQMKQKKTQEKEVETKEGVTSAESKQENT